MKTQQWIARSLFAMLCSLPAAHANLSDAKALIASRQYSAAVQALWPVVYEQPESIDVNMLFADAAFAAGDYEEALFAYQRVLVLDETHARARLGKARTHKALDADSDARRELEFLIERSQDPEVLMECRKLLSKLSTEQRHFFHGVLTVKHELDSNATLGTNDEIPDPLDDTNMQTPTGRSDRSTSLVTVLSHKYKTGIDGLYWRTTGLGFLKEYVRVGSLDMLMVKLSSAADYVQLPWLVSLEGAYGWTWLGSRLTRNQWELGLSGSQKISDAFTLRLRGRHTQRYHFNTSGHSNHHGHVHYLGLDGTYRCNDAHTVVLETSGRFNRSPSSASTSTSFYQLKGRATWLWKAHPRITTDLTGVLRNDWYQQTHSVYTDRKRGDFGATIRGSVSVKLYDCLLWIIDGEYTHNSSNVPTSEYDAARISTGLRGIF